MNTSLATSAPFGALLRTWRGRRGLSQYALAEAAQVSARHLSFLETGRSVPSREMVLRLSRVLEVPLRDRNALLHAAGFSPQYRETPLSGEAMAPIRGVLELMLDGLNPFPALVVDRRYDILLTNSAAMACVGHLAQGRAIPERVLGNAALLLLSPEGLGPSLENRDELTALLLERMTHECTQPEDLQRLDQVRALAQGLDLSPERLESTPLPVFTMRFRVGNERLTFFSTITTVGTPLDVTLQELRVETLLPADDLTRRQVASLSVS